PRRRRSHGRRRRRPAWAVGPREVHVGGRAVPGGLRVLLGRYRHSGRSATAGLPLHEGSFFETRGRPCARGPRGRGGGFRGDPSRWVGRPAPDAAAARGVERQAGPVRPPAGPPTPRRRHLETGAARQGSRRAGGPLDEPAARRRDRTPAVRRRRADPVRASVTGAGLAGRLGFVAEAVRQAFGLWGPEDRSTAVGDWSSLLDLVFREVLAPIVHAGMAGSERDLPVDVAARLRAGYAANQVRSQVWIEPTLRRALGVLRSAGVEPVVVKGAALAYT